MHEKTVSVYENHSSEFPVRIGSLHIDSTKGTDVFSFEYDEDFLRSRKTDFILDPDLDYFPVFYKDICFFRLVRKNDQAVFY